MYIFPEPLYMQLENNEWIFSKYMTLNIPKKYANKSRIALFKEYFKNFTGGTGLLRINQVETNANVAVFSENRSLISERKNSDEEYSIINPTLQKYWQRQYFLLLLYNENHAIVAWLKRGLPMSLEKKTPIV